MIMHCKIQILKEKEEKKEMIHSMWQLLPQFVMLVGMIGTDGTLLMGHIFKEFQKHLYKE